MDAWPDSGSSSQAMRVSTSPPVRTAALASSLARTRRDETWFAVQRSHQSGAEAAERMQDRPALGAESLGGQ